MKRRRPYGAGPVYTDLEKYRLEYFIHNTDMTVPEMAEKIGRPKWGLYQYLWRAGISVIKERRGEEEGSWAGV